ncbi:restriction endonuclease [Paenibacillus lautus]|uniref:restriction endonuclease n=1 Tax=Paenibacillus lautus TaxID=1401 RepID=UPI003D9A3BE5
MEEFINGNDQNFVVDYEIFSVHFSSTENYSSIWLVVRTSSWDFNYERSDIHDLISTILIIILKGFGNISASQITLHNGWTEIPSEIYAKYIFFERQHLHYFQVTNEKKKMIENILKSTFVASFILENLLDLIPRRAIDISRHKAEKDFGEEWAATVAKQLREDMESDYVGFMSRVNPEWRWYYSLDNGISVFKLNEYAMQSIRMLISNYEYKKIIGPERIIICYKQELRNAISQERIREGTRLLKVLENQREDFELILSEDCAYLLSKEHIICLSEDCGIDKVNQEIINIKVRQQREIDILFKQTIFEWKENIDPERFELLVREVLIKEEGVMRVRKIGDGNEPDAGRDLEVDWVLPDKNPYKSPNDVPYVRLNILVQCKAYKRNVGKDRVNDIRDTIDMHKAHGYLLVVSSNITRTLTDYLKELRGRGDYWIDWWTRNELEDRLRKHLDIVYRFNDIVTIMLK